MNDREPALPRFEEICFGLDRATDERSLILFLRLFCHGSLLQTLVPRMTDQEITGLVDHLTGLMRSHLQESEYHELFLNDPDHHH